MNKENIINQYYHVQKFKPFAWKDWNVRALPMEWENEETQRFKHRCEEGSMSTADGNTSFGEKIGHDCKDIGKGKTLEQWFDRKIT